MIFMPICVNVESARLLMVGGGNVALHKLKAVLQYTHNITVVAREIREEIRAEGLRTIEAEYAPEFLDGHLLVYACTNDRELNRRVRDDAHARGLLINVADDAELCDFISPAIYKQENMSVAISSNGEDVRRSLVWRKLVTEALQREKRP